MQRRSIAILGIQAYAFILALVQQLGGVRTDEAKYLLNIPYPHPPLMRSVLNFTEWLPLQDLLWRLVFAFLLVNAVWMVWDLGKKLEEKQRFLLCTMWLLSAAVVLQAGTIMMAPLTAIQGFVFLWLLLTDKPLDKYVGLIALLWFVSLFTAYQAVLFLPIVVAVFWKLKMKKRKRIIYLVSPLILLVAYTFINPLVLESMFNAGTQNNSLSVAQAGEAVVRMWIVGGSIVLSALGTIGIIRSRNVPLLLSIILVAAYIFVSYRNYYAILFTPLFIGGVICRPTMLKQTAGMLSVSIFATAMIVAAVPFSTTPSSANAIMEEIAKHEGEGPVLISGNFGHQWQYASNIPVRRYRRSLLPDARATVCIDFCDGMTRRGWKRLDTTEVQVWVRD